MKAKSAPPGEPTWPMQPGQPTFHTPTVRLHANSILQILIFVPFFVFLVQIREIWDKKHHITNSINFLL